MSRRTPRPHGPVSLDAWAQEPGRVVTRGEVLAILVYEERRRELLARRVWWRRALRGVVMLWRRPMQAHAARSARENLAALTKERA